MCAPAGKRWARPEEPILHDLHDEKAEPHIFFHNINYRASRKYINIEKVRVSGAQRQGLCRERSSGGLVRGAHDVSSSGVHA